MTCRPENTQLDSTFSVLGDAFGAFAYGDEETFFVCDPAEAGFESAISGKVILPSVTDRDYPDPRTLGCQEVFFQASRCYEDSEFVSSGDDDDNNDDNDDPSQTSSASSTSSITTPAVYTGLASKGAGSGLAGAIVGAGAALLL